jgi:hypothetical protein
MLFVHMMRRQMQCNAHAKLVTQAQVPDHRFSVQVTLMIYNVLYYEKCYILPLFTHFRQLSSQ